MGDLVRELGGRTVIGVDSLEVARNACPGDRPGVYHDYLVWDLAAPSPGLLARLRRHRPTGNPPNALALLPTGAPVVFTADERWTQSDGPGGFRTPVTQLLASGELELLEPSRFQHRLSTGGHPIHYELVAGSEGAARSNLRLFGGF